VLPVLGLLYLRRQGVASPETRNGRAGA
jgi:hypothetical protein